MTSETKSYANAFGSSSNPSAVKTPESLRDTIGDAVDRAKSGISVSAEAARTAFGEDVNKLKADILALQKTVSSFAAEAGGTAAGTVKDVGQAVASQVGSAASQVGSAASDAAAAATDQVKTFASELEGMARRNPLGTLAGTLVVGVLVGMMSRGRS